MIAYKSRRIIVSRAINASPEQIWAVLTDTTKWPEWGPSVSAVECRDRFIQPTSSGHIKTALGIRFPFTISSFQHLQFWSWRVGGIEATGHRLVVETDCRCNLLFDLPWWAFPYSFICLVALNRIRTLARSTEHIK